jgi:hypothetical protein
MVQEFPPERTKKLLVILIGIIVLIIFLGAAGYKLYQDKQASQAPGRNDTRNQEGPTGDDAAESEKETQEDENPSGSSETADPAPTGTGGQGGGTGGSSGSGGQTGGTSGSSGGGSTVTDPCANPSGPATITSGGTYTGCYISNTSGTPAITIATTQAVTFSRVTIKHKGFGIFSQSHRANLTVLDSTFIAQPDSSPVEQLDIYAYMPTVFIVENNQFTDGHGVTVNGNNDTTSPFRIRYNNFNNVGKYNAPNCCIGAIHTDKVLAPGGQISWNRVTAVSGQSVSEDAFGIYLTNGVAGNALEISHNLVNGSYPYSGDGAGFTGGAFDFGDGGGSWTYGHDNTAVNYTNNGFMIPSGDNVTHSNSVAVYDGKAGIDDSGPTVVSVYGAGFTTWHNPSYPVTTNASVLGSSAGHLRLNGIWERSDFYLPPCGGCNYSGNSSLGTVNAATEQAVVNNFEASVISAGVTIGPRQVLGASTGKNSLFGKLIDRIVRVLVVSTRLNVL